MVEVRQHLLKQADDVSIVDFVKYLVSGTAGLYQPQVS
jgi:hypothetical protein